jgi:hypothetical protein
MEQKAPEMLEPNADEQDEAASLLSAGQQWEARKRILHFLQLTYHDHVFTMRTDSLVRVLPDEAQAREMSRDRSGRGSGASTVSDSSWLEGSHGNGTPSNLVTPTSNMSSAAIGATPSSRPVLHEHTVEVTLSESDSLLDWSFISLTVQAPVHERKQLEVQLTVNGKAMKTQKVPTQAMSWLFERLSAPLSQPMRAPSVPVKFFRLVVGKSQQLSTFERSGLNASSAGAFSTDGPSSLVLIHPMVCLSCELGAIEVLPRLLSTKALNDRRARRSSLFEPQTEVPELTPQDQNKFEQECLQTSEVFSSISVGAASSSTLDATLSPRAASPSRSPSPSPSPACCTCTCDWRRWCQYNLDEEDEEEKDEDDFSSSIYVRVWKQIRRFFIGVGYWLHERKKYLSTVLDRWTLRPAVRARSRIYLNPHMHRILLLWCLCFLFVPLIPCIYRTV